MTTAITQETNYEETLAGFRDRFNQHSRAQKLTKGWDRLILLESTNTPNRFGFVVRNEAIEEVRRVAEVTVDEDHLVHLRAEEDVLKDIFSGRTNPATALVDGALAVFSSSKDMVKLEALAMVIWRIG